MLRREDLERIDWFYDGDLGAVLVANPSGRDLRGREERVACMQALALACKVVDHFDSTDAPLGREAQDIRSLLFNELTAAGVEVEP